MQNETIVVSLDNTICTGEEDLTRCIPKENAIEAIGLLQDKGNFIIIHTDRPMTTIQVTREWLHYYKIPFNHLQFGQPKGAIYIDSKGYKFNGWKKFIEKVCKKKCQSKKDPLDIYERVLLANMKMLFSERTDHIFKKVKKIMVRARIEANKR